MYDKKIHKVQKELSEVKEDLDDFKDDIPLFTVECEEISKAVKRIGTRALGGKGSKAYSNTIDIVDGYNLTIALKEQISMLNEKVSFA